MGSTTGPRGQPIDVLTVSPELGEEIAVHLSILDFDDLRGAVKPDERGRIERGDLARLTLLMAAPGSSPP